MKILFSSWPAYGHLLPMVPMIRAALEQGHEVLVASGTDVQPLLADRGLPGVVAGPTLAQAYAAAAEANRRAGLTEQFNRMDPQQVAAASARHLFGAAGARRARDLRPLIDDWRPDLVVHDTLELGGPTAAQLAGVPHAMHSYGPLIPHTDLFAVAIGAALSDAGLPDPIPGVFAAPYLDVCPPGLQPDGTGPWSDVLPVRPSAGDALPGETLPAGLARLPHRSTVYLTLGTVTNERPDAFRAVLDALARRRVNVVVTTGPGVDPAAVAGGRSAVLAVPYVSQALVLPHCAAVISHCGAGTMFGALAFGLPQLCLPHGTDQPFNAAAVARAGAGLVLDPDGVTAGRVASALDDVLDGSALRDAARRLRHEIESMPSAGQALGELVGRRWASG